MVTFGEDINHETDKGISFGETITAKDPQSSSGASEITKRRKPVMNKRAEGQRFGLVQWQRLVRSSNDLAQRKGKPLRKSIPWDEIHKHNQPHDCWMVLRGVVYNIGPYLAYHPGGEEILTKVLGKDGTTLFDKYHRWVSIEGLIGTLAIGSVEQE